MKKKNCRTCLSHFLNDECFQIDVVLLHDLFLNSWLLFRFQNVIYYKFSCFCMCFVFLRWSITPLWCYRHLQSFRYLSSLFSLNKIFVIIYFLFFFIHLLFLILDSSSVWISKSLITSNMIFESGILNWKLVDNEAFYL